MLDEQIDETPGRNESSKAYVTRMAETKAIAGAYSIADKASGYCIIGADTCVVVDSNKLGKPRTRTEAAEMLNSLSGRTHQVYSAVCVNCSAEDQVRTALSISNVEFRPLSARQIDEFIAGGETENRAGAYGIQGKAADFIVTLDGSWSGVVGLPVRETISLLTGGGTPVIDYSRAASNITREFNAIPQWNGSYEV